jgi:hypothetical protein
MAMNSFASSRDCSSTPLSVSPAGTSLGMVSRDSSVSMKLASQTTLHGILLNPGMLLSVTAIVCVGEDMSVDKYVRY